MGHPQILVVSATEGYRFFPWDRRIFHPFLFYFFFAFSELAFRLYHTRPKEKYEFSGAIPQPVFSKEQAARDVGHRPSLTHGAKGV